MPKQLTKKPSTDYHGDGIGWYVEYVRDGNTLSIELVCAVPERRYDDVIIGPYVRTSLLNGALDGWDDLDLHEATAHAILEATTIVRQWRAEGRT